MREERKRAVGGEPIADDAALDDYRRDAVAAALERVLAGINRRRNALHSSDNDVTLMLTRRHRRRRQLAAPQVRKLNEEDRKRRDLELLQMQTASDEAQAALDCLYDDTATKADGMQRMLGVVRALLPSVERSAARQKSSGTARRANAAKRDKLKGPIYAKAIRLARNLRAHDADIRRMPKNWKRPAMLKVTGTLSKDELKVLGFSQRLSREDRMRLVDRLVRLLNESNPKL